MTRLAVIDHGAGNLVSMEQALVLAGAEPTRVAETTDLGRFDGVVLPGVGATAAAMRALRRVGLVEPLRHVDRPLLAVCVGMQLLFERSDEDGAECLGLLAGDVTAVTESPLPHMGWNDVEGSDAFLDDRTALYYFVHSYVPRPADPSVVVARTTYGCDVFASVVRAGTTVGAQFHPERSGRAGIRFLERFVGSCETVTRAA